jgi:hypothetical protein
LGSFDEKAKRRVRAMTKPPLKMMRAMLRQMAAMVTALLMVLMVAEGAPARDAGGSSGLIVASPHHSGMIERAHARTYASTNRSYRNMPPTGHTRIRKHASTVQAGSRVTIMVRPHDRPSSYVLHGPHF